jgi:hypothetical protein
MIDIQVAAKRLGVTPQKISELMDRYQLTERDLNDAVLGDFEQDLKGGQITSPASAQIKSRQVSGAGLAKASASPAEGLVKVNPRGKVGARQAIADVVSQRDGVVADLMVRTGEIASSISNPVVERKAQELGQALGQAQVKAIDEVGDFLLGTLGNSQWLLTGAMDVLDGEIVS